MKTTKTIYLALLAVLLSPVANAELIQFDWTNNGTGGALQSGSGFWVIDNSDIFESFNTDFSAVITEFAFEWTTTNNTFSVSSADGDAIGRANLSFDASLNLIGFDVCFVTFNESKVCSAKVDRPLILIKGNLWGATGGDNDPNNSTNNANFVFLAQSVSTGPAQSVPEPGTLALLGLGLVGMASRRRKKV